MLMKDEIDQLQAKGISESEFESQLESFQNGFPMMKIVRAATVEDGIERLTPEATSDCVKRWKSYQNDVLSTPAVKFVPASGAASRMFKNLYEYKTSGEKTDFIDTFFSNLQKFPFYRILEDTCLKLEKVSIEKLLIQDKGQLVVADLLDERGLNFGAYPKGLLPFHAYGEDVRTPFDEHLAESALYTKSAGGLVKIHFTVSNEHLNLFKALAAKRSESYKAENGIKTLNVSFSIQSGSTDTIAVGMDNKPIKVDGKFLFRPGGHGSILKNLNSFDNDADIVFIKNIDNVVPDVRREPVIDSTMSLGGYFLQLRDQMWAYEKLLTDGVATANQLTEIVRFCEDKLCIKNLPNLMGSDLTYFLLKKFHRPFRVCGMVRNLGEPGGGPYYCENHDGTVSLQILERNQISDKEPIHISALKSSTHFNPVNMVCGLKDFRGNKFDLSQYVDPDTAFISVKSKNGVTLKALEHPGLWNGSMSDWNTVFVEMPASTFNPVKTVNDLLRPMHQSK